VHAPSAYTEINITNRTSSPLLANRSPSRVSSLLLLLLLLLLLPSFEASDSHSEVSFEALSVPFRKSRATSSSTTASASDSSI
jgi:hypothetical protein